MYYEKENERELIILLLYCTFIYIIVITGNNNKLYHKVRFKEIVQNKYCACYYTSILYNNYIINVSYSFVIYIYTNIIFV